jgi:hypothetical protein
MPAGTKSRIYAIVGPGHGKLQTFVVSAVDVALERLEKNANGPAARKGKH